MKGWIIYEVQTTLDGVVSALPGVVKTDENEALSEFYFKCGYAAISTAYIATVYLVTNDGQWVDKKSFMHGKSPDPPEPDETPDDPYIPLEDDT